MSNNVNEMSRVRQDNATKLWVVEIMSAAIGRWIVQSVWITKHEAEQDRKNWM